MRLLEIHIEVTNLEQSLKLYSTLLPHKEIKHWEDGSAVAIVFNDGSAFGLWKKGKFGIHNGQGGEHLHFAFQIKPEEYDQFKQRIINVGLEPLEHTWPAGQKSVYFFDADGNQGEFMTKDWL